MRLKETIKAMGKRLIAGIKGARARNKKRTKSPEQTKPIEVRNPTGLSLELLWAEEFDGDLSKWNQDDHIADPLHRTGYKHLELDGSINTKLDYIKVPGRWAALMDKHREKVQFIRNNKLVLKGHIEHIPNPYRKNIDNDQRYGEFQLFGGWLSNWGRKWSEKYQRHITDWDRTKFPLIGPGTVLEVRVNLEAMCMGGARFSIWRMPATREQDTPDRAVPATVVCDQSYNDDPSVKETDLLENENPERYDGEFGHKAFMKCVGGDAGDTHKGGPDAYKNSQNLLKKFSVDLRKGWHVLRLIHHADGTLDFICDGQVINHESRPELNWGYVILSNEFCSGCKHPDDKNIASHENVADGPHQPQDDGLSARSVARDIDMIDKHEALVDWVRAYEIIE